MFFKSLNKASFIIMVPFFIFSFNTAINAQVKYVFHNKKSLKLNRKYTIPRIAKKNIQSIHSNIIKSNSTSSLKLSGVKIIGNKDFKNELSSISSKIGTSTKVETTTISGVEIILSSNNTLANNNLKSKKIQNIVKNKIVRPSKITTVKVPHPTNYIDNEDLFKNNPLEEIDETIIEDFTETLEEINTEEIASETTTELVHEEVEPLETTVEEPLENIVEKTTEEIASETTTELVHEEVEPLETTVEEPLENIVEKTTEEIASETTTELVQEEVEPLETKVEEPLENIVEKTTEKIASEITSELIQESNTVLTSKENNPKKEQPIITNNSNFEISYSAKVENELANKAVLYYTVKVKSVSNPIDGLKFLSKIKDNDAVWDEHTFHLFKDKEKENITNITIGKFVDKENAEKLMEYLKTKNITNPSIEIHENNVKSTVSNVKPISKPKNVTNPRDEIENPVNEVVKSPGTKKEVYSNKNLLDNISTKVDESENYFSVQVGANNKISSTNIQGLNLNKKKLFFMNIEKGKYAMNYGKHEDYGSAHKIALEIHKKGLETAFVTKYENGVRVKITKNDYLTDKTPKKTISDDINQLGYIEIRPNDKGKFIQIGTIYNWDAHNFKSLYDQLERTIYYKVKENNSVIFLVGPLKESEIFIELRTIKQIISDAFIKTI